MQGTFQFVWSMLFISSVVNFEPNCKTWNNRNFWQRQHVLLIMTHESALTLVIGGNGWAGNSAYEFEWKRFPLAHSFLSFSQARLLWMNEWKMTFLAGTPFSVSFTFESTLLFFTTVGGVMVKQYVGDFSTLHKSLPALSHLLSF